MMRGTVHRYEDESRTALKPLPHGGNLTEARSLFPDAPQPWIDLSTGINPDAYPLPAMEDDVFRRLPSPDDLRRLESIAQTAYRALGASATLASAGTHAVLSALPTLLPQARVAILGPTYAEHAHAWRHAGNEVETVQALDQLRQADVAVLVRPNNPDGSFASAAEIDGLLGGMRRPDQLIIVDEAFIDLLAPGSSLVDRVPQGNLLILRSFGKSYGLAGVRLAFSIGQPCLISRLRAALGPWPVSGPAITVGSAALADNGWLVEARARVQDSSNWLTDLLKRQGISVIGSALLFHCVEHPEAAALFVHLGRHGIYIRRFEDQPYRLRIGLPAADTATRSRVEQALQTFEASAAA